MRRAGAVRRLVPAACALLLLACGPGMAPAPADAPTGGVLFIGNSLTGSNDLPGVVRALSSAAGVPLSTTALVAGGASLEDHWRAGAALDAIDGGGWRAVVLQQGPSTQPESRRHLVRWSGDFAARAREAGAAPWLYMVWPPADGDWASGMAAYREAAERADAGLFPVAEAFQAAWRRDPALPLLGDDGFHPSPLGTYLAALVIVAQLAERSPAGLPIEIDGHPAIDPAVAALLQAAAAEAIERHGKG